MTLGAILAAMTGVAIVGYALQTAIRTFLLPQPGQSVLGRVVFRFVQPLVVALDRLPGPAGRRHAWESLYAPLCLVLIVFATMVLISLGYALILFGVGATPFTAAFLVSISSVSTLGFAPLGDGLAIPVVASIETMTGILVVALLIGYLPTIYAAVQQRERGVAALEALVGSPVTARSVLERYGRRPDGQGLEHLWAEWTGWFTALGHSHDSMSALIFVRSPRPGRSWAATAGAVLDAAALAACVGAGPGNERAGACAAAGADSLRGIVAGARLPVPSRAFAGDDPVGFSRSEFDASWAALADAGLPLVADRDAAWSAFIDRRRGYAPFALALEHAAAAGARHGGVFSSREGRDASHPVGPVIANGQGR